MVRICYFAPFGQHNVTETYYTSDYDLSTFTSNFVGLNPWLYTAKRGVWYAATKLAGA